MAFALCSGERAVILLYISRVLFSVPLSLLHEAIALLLLAFAALFVEISTEDSKALDRFKTRPGVSSGILLGTVSLPTVMLSRLIQLSRAFSEHDIGPEELGYINMQYWAVSISCFGVLIFLHAVRCLSLNNTSSLCLRSLQEEKYTAFYIVFYATVCYMSLAKKSYSGLDVAMKLLWILCHGLASVRLIQHILHTFSSCASIGEALLVTGGLVLYFGDMLLITLAKIDAYALPSKLVSLPIGIRRSEISIIIQGVLLGLLLLPVFYKVLLRTWIHFTVLTDSETNATEGRTSEEIMRSIIFYASLVVTLVLIVPAWMQFVQDFHVHPLLWVFLFVFSEPLKRLSLCIYWMGVISASVLRFYNISKNSKIERILLRKYYHLVAVLMFSPALLFQPKFLDLSFGAALASFLALEMIRVWKIWPLGHLVHQFMNAFTDHRDSDILIVSHFSLLLGCALPKWMSSGFNDRPLAPFAGILSLGIGDTMASVVGHKYGVLRWSKTGKKTVEGTAAGITSVLVACSVLVPLLASTGFILSQHWLSLLVAVTVSGLLEAYTSQLDNAFIPLVFYSLLCL
ncbi:phosphatidate cytidylyltransferase family protein [Tasmannia lanceolata]|uniref:phosphatidate cytidylyltransferase family protein n=1 Tax=Tasmannia lanceolata TaxID=3420 RepID=UPI004064684B